MVGTAAHWQARGISRRQLRTLLGAGELVRLRYGEYATRQAMDWAGDNPRRRHVLHVYAAMDSVGRGAVASHQSAAVMHGLDLLDNPGNVATLTFPPGSGRTGPRSRGIRCYAAALPARHVSRMYKVAVTSVERTVVDLARSLPFMAAVVVTDSALHADLVSRPGLMKVVTECAGWPGVSRAGQAIAFADPRAESVLESCGRVIIHEHGLEPPEPQVTIRGPGYSYTVDLYFPRHKTIVEFDGMVKYETRKDLQHQFRRDTVLRDAGYKVVHVTWRELFQTPELVIERIRKAFSARSSL